MHDLLRYALPRTKPAPLPEPVQLHARGESHGSAVLTEDRVALMRRCLAYPDRPTTRQWSWWWGCSQRAVAKAIRGDTWGHIADAA